MRILLILAGLLSLAVTMPAEAQPVPLPNPGFEQFANNQIGDFVALTRVQAGLEATSNIREDPSEDSDFEYQLAALAALRSSWSKHALAVTGSYVRQQGVETSDQLSEALSWSVSGRYDIDGAWHVGGGAKLDEAIVGRSDPLQFIGNLNGTTATTTYEAEIGWQGSQYYANLLGRLNEVENETEVNVTITDLLQAQNRDETDVTLEIGQNYSWGKLYSLAGLVDTEYTGSPNVLPANRDSFGVRLGIGADFEAGKLSGQLRLIAINQDFENRDIGENGSLVGQAVLLYQLQDDFSAGLIALRQFDDINILETSAGLFTNAASVALLWHPAEKIYLKAGPTVNFYQIEGTALEAHSWTADLNIGWQMHPRLQFLAHVSGFTQDANDALLENVIYDETSLTLSAILTF